MFPFGNFFVFGRINLTLGKIYAVEFNGRRRAVPTEIKSLCMRYSEFDVIGKIIFLLHILSPVDGRGIEFVRMVLSVLNAGRMRVLRAEALGVESDELAPFRGEGQALGHRAALGGNKDDFSIGRLPNFRDASPFLPTRGGRMRTDDLRWRKCRDRTGERNHSFPFGNFFEFVGAAAFVTAEVGGILKESERFTIGNSPFACILFCRKHRRFSCPFFSLPNLISEKKGVLIGTGQKAGESALVGSALKSRSRTTRFVPRGWQEIERNCVCDNSL